MKRYFTIAATFLLVIVCTVTYAFSSDYRNIGVWVTFDQDTDELLDFSTAIILGDSYHAYIVALSEAIDDHQSFGFLSPNNNTVIDLELKDYYNVDSPLGFGLFKLDGQQKVTVTSIARSSPEFLGNAYLHYLDLGSVENVGEISDLSEYCQQSSVCVIKNDGVFMYLDRAPGGAMMGAAILSEDKEFIGYYYGKTEDGYCAITADRIVECFPLLEDFYANGSSDGTTAQVSGTTEPIQMTAPAGFDFGELISEPNSGTQEETAEEPTDDTKRSSQSKMVLIAALGVAIVAGIAAAVFVNKRKSNDGGFSDETKTGETAYSSMDGYTADTNVPDSFFSGQSDFGATQNLEPLPSSDPRNDGLSDGLIQIEDIDNAPAVGETVPLYCPPEPVPQASICIVGKGGFFNKKRIVQPSEIIIGRHPQRCTLHYPIDAKGVSAVHCRLTANGRQGVEITDLGSTYGTFVNGVRLQQNVPTVLHDGDTFWLADPSNSFFVAQESK